MVLRNRMIGIAATRIVISLYTRDAHQCGSRRSCSRSLMRWTLPVAVRGRSWAISNRRGRHRSRAVGAGRWNDIEHDLREPNFAFAQHGRSFADRADAGQHILDLGRRDPDAGHPQHITRAAAVMIESVRVL